MYLPIYFLLYPLKQMEPIFIPNLAQAPQKSEEVEVKAFLAGLETLTPVRGKVRVEHHGNFLQVSCHAETIITCTCDRCLQQYNHRLVTNASEIIWLQEPEEENDEFNIEREVAMEDLVESVSPQGYFDVQEWLYQQLCLEIPQRQLCNLSCPGIQPQGQGETETPVDSRWASLQALKNKLSN